MGLFSFTASSAKRRTEERIYRAQFEISVPLASGIGERFDNPFRTGGRPTVRVSDAAV
jgi:hypothetical protein